MRVCDGLACELAGAQDLLARLPQLLGAEGHQDVRVISAPCIGRCEQAPAVAVQQRAVPLATADKVLLALAVASPRSARLVNFSRAELAEKSISPALEAVDEIPAFTDYATYRANGGYALAAALVNGEADAEAILKAMEDSGLRGLGGAGFPAGRKWRIVREQPAPRLMAVNIDEGEPGTFKDRTYLERDPHRFLEGLLVAAQVRRHRAPATSTCATNTTTAARCWRPSWPSSRPTRPARCPGSSCAAAPAPTSAARSPR